MFHDLCVDVLGSDMRSTHLVDCWRDSSLGHDLLEVWYLEVADADAPMEVRRGRSAV
jgi:hypothetical protein